MEDRKAEIMNDSEKTAACHAQAEESTRVILQGVSVNNCKDTISASVTLVSKGEQLIGNASFQNAPGFAKAVVAAATLNAANKCLGREGMFSVYDTKTVSAGNVTVEVVAVLCDNDDEAILIGAAFDKNNTNLAVAKAALDAINRKITFVM